MGTNGEHNFVDCLERSQSASDNPIWETIYRKAFPTMLGMFDHRQDGQHQRNGIDRSIVLDNGKPIWIDEKVRGRNKKTGQVYSDIALEYLSNEARGTPGWVCKPLLCDYIAYAILPLGVCYLMPVPQLQAAWKKYGTKWIITGKEVRAANEGYWTISTAITAHDLFLAILEMMQVHFTPVDFNE